MTFTRLSKSEVVAAKLVKAIMENCYVHIYCRMLSFPEIAVGENLESESFKKSHTQTKHKHMKHVPVLGRRGCFDASAVADAVCPVTALL